ncbi:MAG TPA: hypothetical protein VFH60_03375 [Chloroflexia bacterium]|nr:hypothetical protein [Chloroflexia bacterium]
MTDRQELQSGQTRATPARPDVWRIASWALTGALALLLVGLAVKSGLSAATSAQMWAYPFQFDESEGMIVAETMLLDRGVSIFDVPGPDLFISAPYPPLFYLLNLPGQHLAGAEPTFKVGRTLSILATIFVGITIFGVVVALTRDRLAGAVGAAAWWSLGVVTFWGSLVKPDMTAVALGLAGLWWLAARPERQAWWALVFFLAAFYTKQTAIAAAGAGILWLLVMRPRTGFGFAGAYAVGAIVPSAILTWLTGGGYYYHQGTFELPGLPDPVHDLPWMPERFALYVSNFVASYWVLLVPGMLAVLLVGLRSLWVRISRRGAKLDVLHRGAILLLAYMGMSVFVSIGTGTLGGNHNHLLDGAAAGGLGLGLAAGMARRAEYLGVKLAGVGVALVAIIALPSLFATPEWLRLSFSPLEPGKYEGMRNIFQYVTNNGGPAYSDNVGLLLTTGKRLWTTDPYTQTHATQYGRWDESKLVAEIRRKGFAQVILRIDIFAPDPGAGDVSPGILQALRDNYKLDQRNVENIYVPR